MQGTTSQDPVNYEYKLRPVLFLVPRGAAPTAFEARKKEAEALRARFQSCEEGLRSAMALPDVAVRETITRQSADLGEAQRKVLNDTPVGRLTPPDITPQGVEVFAVCSKTVGQGRHARQAQGARRDVQRALSGGVEEVPERAAQPGADRVQVRHDATAGADARRAGWYRSGYHAGGMAAARRAWTAAVLSPRRSGLRRASAPACSG